MNMNIQNVCIVGAGTLGTRVALQAALSGFQVRIYDLSEELLERSKQTMRKLLGALRKEGRFTTVEDEVLWSRLFFTTDPATAVEDADLINESVTEDVAIKQEVWKHFGALAPKKTLFTTNTSYLLPSMFAEQSGRPERFCALHFHDVFTARIVDIMPHPGTDPNLIPVLERFGEALEQVPVLVKKENSGYLFNTMLLALIGAAGKLLTKEVASVEDIDKSWMVNFHMPQGPFGILDNIGLDTAYHVTKARKDPASQQFASLLKTYVDAGKLGKKSGEGFYRYK